VQECGLYGGVNMWFKKKTVAIDPKIEALEQKFAQLTALNESLSQDNEALKGNLKQNEVVFKQYEEFIRTLLGSFRGVLDIRSSVANSAESF
jgi:FtsZ-binding cell division protein ZapB